jgi:hypothetical protein
LRAYLLLSEEFPLAVPYIEKRETDYLFNGPVAGFEGVGRFVLGLMDEVKVKGPENFKTFLSKKLSSDLFGK